MIKVLNNKKGSSMVFFAISLTTLICMAAFVADIGMVILEKSILSNSVDASALAGAQDLVANPDTAKYTADTYLSSNATNINSSNVIVDPVSRTIKVDASKSVGSYFAKIFGKDSFDIYSSAEARVENIKSLVGARPLAVIEQNFIYGNMYTLKDGAGDASSGNYAAIALGGTGNSNYRDKMLAGYNQTISVGDLIETETGNMAGTTETTINQLISQCDHVPKCTYDSYNPNCPRIIFIPVVDTLDISGRKYVKVQGFATFFLEAALNNGGHTEVTGRFITYDMQGEMSSDIKDFGTYGIKLTK
jgi:hypothetical protein